MKLITTTKLGALALSGMISLVSTTASHAALVGPLEANIPGEALGASVANFGGTFVSETVSPFSDVSLPSNFSGSLRSTVVRNAGGNFDFYYQLSNTTPTTANIPDPEIFRLAIQNFRPEFSTSGSDYEIFSISNGLTGIVGAPASVNGTVAAFSADRQVGIQGRGIGFDFGDDHFIDDTTAPFTNLFPGQTGNFLAVRTTATRFTSTNAQISGAGSASAGTLVPIPEPATALVGLALSAFIGSAEFGRGRRRKAKA